MNREILAILVENSPGVLARISGLFSRRGYNIESLTVTATNNPKISRITATVLGTPQIITQIMEQVNKLEETKSSFLLDQEECIQRELLLIKVRTDKNNLNLLKETAEIFCASIVDLSADSMIIEVTGKPSKLNRFLEVMVPYTICEMCRTGLTAMMRGDNAAKVKIISA